MRQRRCHKSARLLQCLSAEAAHIFLLPNLLLRRVCLQRGRRVALEIAKGLHYLHWRRMIHFDLKSGEQTSDCSTNS